MRERSIIGSEKVSDNKFTRVSGRDVQWNRKKTGLIFDFRRASISFSKSKIKESGAFIRNAVDSGYSPSYLLINESEATRPLAFHTVVSKEFLYTCCALTLHRVALLGDSRRLQRQ